MARTDYYAITTPTLQATSQAIRSVNGTVGIIAPEDYPDLISAMHSSADYDNVMAQLIEETASGAVVSFADGANNIPVKALKANVDPIQDLHGYDKPWVGGAGKNKLPYIEVGAIDQTTGQNKSGNTTRRSPYVKVSANSTYTISGFNSTSKQIRLFWYQADETYIGNDLTSSFANSYTFTTGANVGLMRFQCADSYAEVGDHLQIEAGSSATAYEPYENICPISGRTSSTLTHTGKNLCQIPSWTGHSGTVYFTGGYSIPANVTFTFSALVERDGSFSDRFVVIFRFADGTASEWTYVTPNTGIRRSFSKTYTKEIIGLQFYCREGYTPSQQATGTIMDIQIESGSTATAYEPYVGTTHTTDFGQTVYGGSLNLTTGVLTIDKGFITYDGSENWSYGNNGYTISKPTGAGQTSATDTGLCNMAERTDNTNVPNGTYRIGAANVIVRLGTGNNDVPTFKAFLANNNMQLVYPLATPIEIQLTPTEVNTLLTLLGGNTFFADSGEVEVTYRANGELYVQTH